ncbi:MAG: hypothetical protein K2M19_08120 [Muribaculaceae bacterium]|nr:hypothetical protein [Muribaculaceae bacterium]
MKKALLFASMGLLSLSAVAQGVDPAAYKAKEGYKLENLWLMSLGDGEKGVAMSDWNDLCTKMADATKGTMAARLGDKVYVACSMDFVTTESGELSTDAYGHLLVLDAATGKFIKDLTLTYEGKQLFGTLCANCIGTDDFGHLWITPYVSDTYKAGEDGVVVPRPIPLYMVNPETGEMTKVTEFALDDVEGPEGCGRVDNCDLRGDITREKARCVFMSIPAEGGANVVCAWHCEQGSDEWNIDVNAEGEGYCVIKCEETYPADKVNWGYTPVVSILADDDFSGNKFYVDAHSTLPALYDYSGEKIDDFSKNVPEKDNDDDPWTDFFPKDQPCGVRQFSLGGQDFLVYGVVFPEPGKPGGGVAIIKLGENGIEDATPLWLAPEAMLGEAKGGGRFTHSISISPELTDANGKRAVEIMIFKESNGVAMYLLSEEGYVKGIEDAVADIVANGPAKFYNLNGVEVNENNLTAGVYVTLQNGVAKKVVIK